MPDELEPPPTTAGHGPPPRARGRGRAEPSVLAAIALGGALGAPVRYGVTQLFPGGLGRFPWGTVTANVTGSFALGLALALILDRFPPTRYLRPFVATGFLGAYTTYSTFAVEADLLVRDGSPIVAVGYAAGSLLAGLAAAGVGIRAARIVPPLGRADTR
ncbi:MAG TPA: CrcB family protein [Acidimicrobiales bacterium]